RSVHRAALGHNQVSHCLSGVTLDCALVNWQALSRRPPRLTLIRLNQIFWRFFVSLNGSASGRSNGGTKFRPANAVRIGANDARHREHLMAPARQLTSSASLKGKGSRGIDSLQSEAPRRARSPRLSRIN